MEFVKIYSTAVPNAARTLDRRVPIAPLLAKATSERVRSSLSLILEHGELNFWDFGVRATPQLSINDTVKIICRKTCYSGQIIQIINDPTGELGDLLGWSKIHGSPWRNVCALSVHSSAHISEREVMAIVGSSRETEQNFYSSFSPARKPEALVEGAIVELTLTTYERDPAARRACLDHYGTQCQVCGLDFGEVYGELGRGFIHVHHVTALSQVREAHVVDPIKDLVPVCPNCHAMLHINQGEPLAVEKLRAVVAAIGSNNSFKPKPLRGSA